MTITNKLKRNLKNKGDNCMSKNHRNIIIEQDLTNQGGRFNIILVNKI